ncbi:major facilitator superfamily domain-containing protein [Glomus cerebriforme]|uniref:Major facilitator superfamily domain-containing protein n=1 Tax=Glomus cerebriforme TaxID=658196 RepID=A0A397S454_9GLOM|nr:major facilitator superfamily domain-containing protein [Glomus cerebriforme]
MISQNIKINLSYIGALIICTVSGTSYLFGAYSTELADKLEFNSVEINTIGSAANYGFYLSSPFFGHIADNYGSNRTCLVSSFVIFFSYLCVALTYNGLLPSPSFLICAFYLFFMGIASAAGLICSLATVVRNLEIRSARRGIALGAPLGFYGLSSFIFSRINIWFFRGNVEHFLVFLAIVTGLGQFIGSWFLNVVLPPPSVQREEIVAVARTTFEQATNLSSNNNCSIKNNNVNQPSERTSLLSEAVANHIALQHHEENDIGGWDLAQDNDARLLFFILFFIGGTGLMFINNVGTIIKTLYLSVHNNHPPISSDKQHHELQTLQNLHVSLFSMFSCFARLSVGFLSDITKNIFNIRRLWFIAISGLTLFAGQMVAGFGVKNLDVLWIASVFIGFGCGTMFGIAPTITSEWFGAARFGSN